MDRPHKEVARRGAKAAEAKAAAKAAEVCSTFTDVPGQLPLESRTALHVLQWPGTGSCG